MTLGLDTSITQNDIIVSLIICVTLFITVQALRLFKASSSTRRGSIWIVAGWLLGAAWWIDYDKSYFPQQEVVTAVLPALQHPYLFPWEAPYGALWYAMNIPIHWIGDFLFGPGCFPLDAHHCWPPTLVPQGVDWMMGLLMFNALFIWMFRRSELLPAYFMTSMFVWFVVPWNLSVLWLVVLGLLGSSFPQRLGAVLLGVISKLPVGAPLSVWMYDFVNGQEYGTTGSAFVPGHWMPYFVLGAWSLVVFLKPYYRFLSLDSYYGVRLQLPLESVQEGKDHSETVP